MHHAHCLPIQTQSTSLTLDAFVRLARPPIDGSFTRVVVVRRSVDSTRNETRERPIVPPFTSAKRPHRVRVHFARESSVRPSVLQVGGVRVHASEKTKRNRPYAIIDGARKERFASSIHRDAPRITRRAGRRTQSGGGACAPAGRPVGRSVVSRHTYLVRRCTNRLRRRRGRHHRGRRYRSSLSVVVVGIRRMKRRTKRTRVSMTRLAVGGGGGPRRAKAK